MGLRGSDSKAVMAIRVRRLFFPLFVSSQDEVSRKVVSFPFGYDYTLFGGTLCKKKSMCEGLTAHVCILEQDEKTTFSRLGVEKARVRRSIGATREEKNIFSP